MTALVICFQPNPHLELGDFPGLCTFHFTFPWSLSRFRIYKDIRSIRRCPPSFIEDLDKSLKNMETSQEHAPLASGSLSGSSEALVPTETTRGVSNKRAFKIAGLTTLACLLLASQVFTAYLVFNQNKQIDSLQSNGENMRKELKNTRSQMPAVQMRMPMHSMPLFMDFTEDEAVADTEPMTNLEQVKDLLQNSQLPQFNETFLANLQSLKEQMEESEWKGFESWMRHWLIFQMAQQAPAPPTQKAPVLQTKCQVEAAAKGGSVWPGSFKPHCDELGNYMPMQCHPSTGYCWCVDASGTEIANTRIRGKPNCNRAARRMMAFPTMIKLEAFSDGDE